MNIQILCDQTDCRFNITKEESVFKLANAATARHNIASNFNIATLMLGIHMCVHHKPHITKHGVGYTCLSKERCMTNPLTTKDLKDIDEANEQRKIHQSNAPISCLQCDSTDIGDCINCCHNVNSTNQTK